jgi:hypothetical protein
MKEFLFEKPKISPSLEEHSDALAKPLDESLEVVLASADRAPEGNWYEYPPHVEALLEIGYLEHLEQGVFMRIEERKDRVVHPDLGPLAGSMLKRRTENKVLKHLLKDGVLFLQGNDIYHDAVFESQKTGSSKACETEMARAAPVAAAMDAKNWRSGKLASARLEPQDEYIYPPHVVALLELGYLVERNQGIFERRNTPAERLQRKDLGQLARKCLTKTCKEKEFLAFLLDHGLLFECNGDSGLDMFWNDVVEKIERAKLSPSLREQLLGGCEKSDDSVLSAAVELCDVSEPGLASLLGSLPASYTSDRNVGVHKAPRIDNSNVHAPAVLVNGHLVKNMIIDTGCEMVVMGRDTARQAALKPSMMQRGAVALRCADERVTPAFDRTLQPVPLVLNLVFGYSHSSSYVLRHSGVTT